MTVLTVRFDEALAFAHAIHREHARHGLPMIAHLLGVTSLVLEFGGDEDEAIGALLHDAGEDAGGRERVEEIRTLFGDRVAEIVDDCTDAYGDPQMSWRESKERYLAHVPEAGDSGLLVSAADKLWNVRELTSALHRKGTAVWDDYKGGREGRLWYYRAAAAAFEGAGEGRITPELARAVEVLEAADAALRRPQP